MIIWMIPKVNLTNKFNELFSRSVENQGIKVNSFDKKYFFEIKRGDIIHFHWINGFYQSKYRVLIILRVAIFFIYFGILKLRGVKIVWTVHNLYPHQYNWIYIEKIVRNLFMKYFCNKLVVASSSIKKELIKEFAVKQKKVVIVPHGHYYGAYPIHSTDIREKYNIAQEKTLFLFIGAVKKYKGIIELLNAFNELDDKSSILLIVGKVDAEIYEKVRKLSDSTNVIFDPRFVPDDELGDLINSSDYVVLPYTSITTSGSAILAVSLRKKIIAPKTPFMEEYFDKTTSILYDVTDPDGLRNALKYCNSDINNKYIRNDDYNSFLKRLDWDNIGKKMLKVYKELI